MRKIYWILIDLLLFRCRYLWFIYFRHSSHTTKSSTSIQKPDLLVRFGQTERNFWKNLKEYCGILDFWFLKRFNARLEFYRYGCGFAGLDLIWGSLSIFSVWLPESYPNERALVLDVVVLVQLDSALLRFGCRRWKILKEMWLGSYCYFAIYML